MKRLYIQCYQWVTYILYFSEFYNAKQKKSLTLHSHTASMPAPISRGHVFIE